MQDHMCIGTYCQYVVEKQFWPCKKWWEPKRLALPPLFRVVAPPFGPVSFGGNKILHCLAVIFSQDLRDFFLQESCVLQVCKRRNSHSPITPLETLQDQTIVKKSHHAPGSQFCWCNTPSHIRGGTRHALRARKKQLRNRGVGSISFFKEKCFGRSIISV
jgi:hypothetical protein